MSRPRYDHLSEFNSLEKIAFLLAEFTDPLDGVDLESEYKLIQLKKSKLSRANRERVIFIIESKPLSDVKEVEL